MAARPSQFRYSLVFFVTKLMKRLLLSLSGPGLIFFTFCFLFFLFYFFSAELFLEELGVGGTLLDGSEIATLRN